MATAELKAVLGIDSKDYETGIKKVTGETRSFQSEIQKSGNALRSTSKVASGFQQIAQGNFAQGIASMVGGLTKLGDAAAAATVKIGAVFGALAAGWQIGKRLDDKFDISDRIAKQFGDRGPTVFDEDTAFRKERRVKRQEGEGRAAEIREDTAAITDPTLNATLRLKADYERKVAEITKLSNEAQTADEKAAYTERLEVLRTYYNRQDAVLEAQYREQQAKKKAADEKAIAAEREARQRAAQDAVKEAKRVEDAVAKEQETTAKRIAAVRGREFTQTGQGIRVDSMAATGGLVGGGRAGLQQKSKELQVAMESLRRQVEIKTIQQESLNTQREIRDRLQPTGAPL